MVKKQDLPRTPKAGTNILLESAKLHPVQTFGLATNLRNFAEEREDDWRPMPPSLTVSTAASSPTVLNLSKSGPPRTPDHNTFGQLSMADKFQSPLPIPDHGKSRNPRNSNDSGYYSNARTSIGESPKDSAGQPLGTGPRHTAFDRRQLLYSEQRTTGQAVISRTMDLAHYSAINRPEHGAVLLDCALQGEISSPSILGFGPPLAPPTPDRFVSQELVE